MKTSEVANAVCILIISECFQCYSHRAFANIQRSGFNYVTQSTNESSNCAISLRKAVRWALVCPQDAQWDSPITQE